MPRRTNPWPAFVDLFSVLLTATFAGFIMLSSAYEGELANFQKREGELAGELAHFQKSEQEKKEFRERALAVKDKVKDALNKDASLGASPRACGDDLCIDLYVHFALNDDEITSDQEKVSLSRACKYIKNALDSLPADEKKDLGLVVEGHTDSKQANIPDSRERERFNWNLSARRASSVLYEFRGCGLQAPDYQIVAIGYSDTLPLPDCKETSDKCDERNRRTTLRLHADTAQIEERLNRSGR